MKLTLQKVSRYVSKGLNINLDKIQDCFSPATKKDLDGLIIFRKNNFKSPPLWDDRSYLQWRYSFDENTDNNNKIWVFKSDDNILACLGVEEVTLCINKKKVRAHKAMDLLVHSKIEGIGLSAWMTLVFMDEFPTIFATGSTRSSYSMISNLFCEMEHRQTRKLLIRVNTKLKRKLKSELLSNLLSMPVNLALSIYQNFIYKDLPKGYTLKPLNSIPEQVDTFIDENCKQIYVQRTKKYLDWRFIENPRRKFIILGLYVDDKLSGISFSIINNFNMNNQKDGFIIDWVYDKSTDSSNNIVHCLLQETVKYLKKEKLNSILSSVYDISSSNIYNALGFIKRDYNETFFTHTSDKSLEPYLYNNKLWYLTESDANTDLY
ncbi:MAG: hypothetical protein QNL62_19945 [Gammaproteobacteria bacterium]|nr:hypothetical protein [Gammaproteobacteria bacterium]